MSAQAHCSVGYGSAGRGMARRGWAGEDRVQCTCLNRPQNRRTSGPRSDRPPYGMARHQADLRVPMNMAHPFGLFTAIAADPSGTVHVAQRKRRGPLLHIFL